MLCEGKVKTAVLMVEQLKPHLRLYNFFILGMTFLDNKHKRDVNRLRSAQHYLSSMVLPRNQLFDPRGGGHFNFVCTGVCGHRIGKLTHPQTKACPSIDKNTPILRLN